MTSILEKIQGLQFGWRDAVDILIVAFLLYSVLNLIRGTRAMQISLGLLILIGLNFVARALQLPALEMVSGQLLFYLPFAIIVLFQHEIRRALASVARKPLGSLWTHRPEENVHEEIVRAATDLARLRIGALFVLEKTQNLRLFMEAGRELDAIVSAEILINIFTPNTPLHDGAVVIHGNRIIAAGVFLPLSTNTDVIGRLGTRHRAALGLSEETDALVIAISEENGAIAAAFDGGLQQDLTAEELTQVLRDPATPIRVQPFSPRQEKRHAHLP
jgi:diadenylate cyclase